MAAPVKKVPLRKCTGCQEMKSKKEMLRILRTAEGEIIVDTSGRKKRARSLRLPLYGLL